MANGPESCVSRSGEVEFTGYEIRLSHDELQLLNVALITAFNALGAGLSGLLGEGSSPDVLRVQGDLHELQRRLIDLSFCKD